MSSSTSTSTAATTDSCSVFLSPEERYQVWLVKAAERPELLLHNNDKHDEGPLPLIDGCDIPGWRCHGLVAASDDDEHELLSVLNVGQGSCLLRRERQVPLPSLSAETTWSRVRKRLLRQEPSTIARINSTDPCLESLHPWFERDNIPAVFDGARDWKAMQSCRFDALVAHFGDLEWRISDTHGECLTLETFAKYIDSLQGMLDDAPLAIYDSQFGEAEDHRAELLDDYSVPPCFDSDLFALLSDDDDDDESSLRPPYRWILMGPARSGTGLHIDPVGTHAWVTLVQGLKRWVLFPYGTSPASINMQSPQIPSAVWFCNYYEKIMPHHPKAIEFLQRPGETVYVPAGWPHVVLNLELSVAITHNYATQYPSMQRLLDQVDEADPELAQAFRACLQVMRPELLRETE